MKKTLFLTIFTLLLIGCSIAKKSTNSNSSVTNDTIKENPITNYSTEETYIDPVEYEEEMPEFPGRIAECMKFIKKNMQYPAEAIKEGIEGRVICQFTVKTDGSIDNIIILKSDHESLNEEAIRIIKSMPKWIPGKNKNGEVEDCKYTLPIIFKLPQ